MINTPITWRKKQRSLSISNHSKILHHYHKMFRSISHNSSSRNNHNFHDAAAATANSTSELSATTHHRKSIPLNLFGSHQSIKKAFSLIFHRIDSAIGNHVDDTEMHEFVRYTTSEENLNTIHRSTSTNSSNNQRSLFPHTTCRKTVHERISRWKNKLKCRHEQIDCNHEKNMGFLVVVNPDSEPVLISNEILDHQQTQHAQPCVQINDDASFDPNQIQYSFAPPILSPTLEASNDLYLPSSDIRLNNELEFQSTRSSVECGVPQADLVNIQSTQMSHMISIASPCSTNSSSHEYTGIDRTLLDDVEYVRAQEFDLFRLIDAEIDLCKELSYLKQDLEEEEDFSRIYDETLQENLKLQEDLRALQEEHDPHNSSWSCKICTFLNKPFSETGCNVCEMCEGPSPLKQATLIQ